ncbi:hypothetical protein Bbelb_397650 [Branchiostoma belcheri]|nr:hypothetical protein Bbelb_397650 [Branchiostoma belcheri]
MEGSGASYRGTVSVTKTGRTCQRWDSQTPHVHDRTPWKYPSSGLEQNYCRNPDGTASLWCYTMHRSSRWEYCNVPNCASYSGHGWRQYNNHWYKLMKDKVCWTTAKSACERVGAKLASVRDQGENNFIKELVVGAPRGHVPYVWLGLLREGDQWKWTDGSRATYTNWAPHEPNNNKLISWGKGENCGGVYSETGKKWIILRWSELGQWNDNTCSWKYPYICKRPK